MRWNAVPNADPGAFGRTLASLRRTRGWTQEQVAARIPTYYGDAGAVSKTSSLSVFGGPLKHAKVYLKDDETVTIEVIRKQSKVRPGRPAVRTTYR